MPDHTPTNINPTPDYDWVCYSFESFSQDDAKTLEELIDTNLKHVTLGIDATDDPHTNKYAVKRYGSAIYVYVEKPHPDGNVTDLIHQTVDHWKTSAIAFGYRDDEHGEVFTYKTENRRNQPRKPVLTSYYIGDPGMRGWDAGVGGQLHLGTLPFWMIKHPPGVNVFNWPAPTLGEYDYDSSNFRPDNLHEIQDSIENQYTPPEPDYTPIEY